MTDRKQAPATMGLGANRAATTTDQSRTELASRLRNTAERAAGGEFERAGSGTPRGIPSAAHRVETAMRVAGQNAGIAVWFVMNWGR